jgi:hypothetical protein
VLKLVDSDLNDCPQALAQIAAKCPQLVELDFTRSRILGKGFLLLAQTLVATRAS